MDFLPLQAHSHVLLSCVLGFQHYTKSRKHPFPLLRPKFSLTQVQAPDLFRKCVHEHENVETQGLERWLSG